MLKIMTPLSICTVSLMGIIVIADITKPQNSNGQARRFKAQHHAVHSHGIREIAALSDRPALAINVTEDSFSNGWNIELKTRNFEFSPEHVNSENIDNEGHAHIYIDGKKVARVYSPWNYIFDLTPGLHTIRVTLNSNDHNTLAVNGIPVEATINVVQKTPDQIAQSN